MLLNSLLLVCGIAAVYVFYLMVTELFKMDAQLEYTIGERGPIGVGKTYEVIPYDGASFFSDLEKVFSGLETEAIVKGNSEYLELVELIKNINLEIDYLESNYDAVGSFYDLRQAHLDRANYLSVLVYEYGDF